MNSLVAYGNSSDSSDNEGGDCIVGHLVSQKPDEASKSRTATDLLATDDDFDASIPLGSEGTSDGANLFSSLPEMANAQVSASKTTGEDGLEDFVKETKSWEVKYKEKAEAKLKKIQAKREKPEFQKKTKGKKKIVAFTAAPDDDDEDYQVAAPPQAAQSAQPKVTSRLISMLPAPKNKGGSVEMNNIFLKTSPKKVVPVKSEPSTEPTAPILETKEDSDSDSELPSDFFGLSANARKRQKLDSSPVGASDFKINVQPAITHGEYGPARPTPMEEQLPLYGPSLDVPSSSAGPKQISDEKAYNLINRYEMQPWGFSDRNAAAAVGSMKEVNMNEMVGSGVRETLLRNLNNKGMADASAPTPSTGQKGDAKPKRDVTSKRKHQITYLADLAVSRDEQLREQWAQNRQSKQMSRQKYGF
ncbi:hypothetical protein L596_004771 [Steinernema carpocapsae]|uniref:Proline-rich protein PRCC n=1 Tax=Steinernema carpocapsae TaxID=34508 RepID=A0A4U8V103_STECR|nr:hypothetical protein L596_004771 [Steinernema carpocapsae]